MDPDAALQRYRDARAQRDHEEAREARRNLRDWLASGGFKPHWADDTERKRMMRFP